MIFKGGVDLDVDLITALDVIGEFLKRDIVTHSWVSIGKENHVTTFKGRHLFDENMSVRAVGHPDVLREKLGENDGGGFGFNDTDRSLVDAEMNVIQEVETEEAVLDRPAFQDRVALFEETGDPGVADMGVEGRHHLIDHPVDRLTGFGLAKEITLGGVMHLFDSEFTGGDEGIEIVEVVSSTGLDHRHGGQHETDRFLDLGLMLLPDGLEGVAEYLVPFHRLARVRINN